MSRALLISTVGFIFVCVLAVPFIGTRVEAQVSGSTDPLSVDVSPQNPVPYETVTITPSSNLFDISNASVSVSVNGTPYYSGSGGAGISIPMGGPGTSSTIVIHVTSGGSVNSKTIVLRPASVALVVEPVSNTHPFYRGEGLVTSGAPVRIIAMPDLRSSPTKAIDSSQLVYTWSFGDQVLDSDSGIGKSVLNAAAPPQYRDAPISVTVATQDGSIIAQAQTTISPVTPLTRIYQNDPLLGPLFDVALPSSFTMTDAEDTYRGVGYYFSELPVITWQVNGVASGNDQDLTVRSTGNGTGSAVLNFQTDQSDNALSANSTLSVIFGTAPSTGIFGL